MPMRTLTDAEAQRFYDAFGLRQDRQSFYEAPALEVLVEHARLGEASSLFELGCGTGRFAAELLTSHLPPTARYLGVDSSRTMVALASARLRPFADRALVARTGGDADFPLADRSQDRVVATYVLDLLSEERIRSVLDEAHRVLGVGGLLCVAGITSGTTALSRLVMGGWRLIGSLRPSLVGGCRPLCLGDRVSAPRWEVRHREVVVAYGVASEVLIAAAAPRAAD